MALHVLQLGPVPPPEGGISRNMLAIRKELLARGYECSIVATSKSSKIVDETDVYHPRSPLALVRLLATLKFDILHLHIGGAVDIRVLALIFVAGIFARKKSVLTLHSGGYPETKSAMGATPSSVRGRIFRTFSRIIAVNGAIAEVFRRYGVSDHKLKTIAPHSLQLPDDRIAVPDDLASFISKHSPVLLTVGGLESDYDPMFQVAAMKEILVEFPNAGLMLVGDGTMRDQVNSSVAKSGYGQNIHIAGNVEHSITLHLIKSADALLRTTLFDGDAISVREAMFLGTQVIATDTAIRPDGVHLIGVRDTASLAAAVKNVLKSEKAVQSSNAKADNSNITMIVEMYEGLAGV